MKPDYYREYYTLERGNWWFKARLELLESYLESLRGPGGDLTILNVGAATCATSQMLERFGRVKSVEYDQEVVNYVKSVMNIDLEQGDLEALRFPDNSYDLVCAFDVLEHVKDDRAAAAELIRVCKPEGVVLVTVPAFMSLWGKHDEVNCHRRRYAMKTLIVLFDPARGKIICLSYFNTLLFLPILIARLISRKFPNLFRREGAGSDHRIVKAAFLDRLLYRIFSWEKTMLKAGLKFPFGVSLLLGFRKNASSGKEVSFGSPQSGEVAAK